MRFRDLRIGKKLGLISAVTVALVVVITLLSIYGFGKIGRAYLQVKDNSVPDIVAILEIKANFEKSFIKLRKFLYPAIQYRGAAFKQSLQKLEQSLAKYEVSENNHREKDIKQKLYTYKKLLEDIGNRTISRNKEWARL
ncbi:unnamed protein product, partial [marine sediment metagenome]